VLAVKVSLPGTDTYEYVRPLISGAPQDLRDGLYKLTFDGRTVPVQRHGGAWLSVITH
jgi:hypothetical protein